MEEQINELSGLFFKEHEGRVYQIMVESLERRLLARVLNLTSGNQLEDRSALPGCIRDGNR